MKPTARKFVYRPRSAESVRERANMKSGQFDSLLKPNVKVYKVRDGKNSVRILPPTWEDADHYGLDVWVVYGVGADKQKYLSLSKMLNQKDPLAEAQRQAEREGDKDLAQKLKPKRRIGMYVIDRMAEDEGPQLWLAPFTVDKDFAGLSFDDETNEALMLDDPESGYDIRFVKEGTGLNTEYPSSKMRIAREPTPLHSDEKRQAEWLEYAARHPVPDCLNFYSYEHISDVFNGAAPAKSEDDEGDDREQYTRLSPAPKSKAVAPADDDEDDDSPPFETTENVASSLREKLAARAKAAQAEAQDDSDEDEEPPRRRARA